MKKLIISFILSVVSVLSYAQKPAYDIYAALYGGTSFHKACQPSAIAGVEIGTYIVPSAGISIEAFETFKWNKGVRSNALLNGKINFTNLFTRDGLYPKTFDVVGFAGAGFGHESGSVFLRRDYVALIKRTCFLYAAGLEFGVNFGKYKEWQVVVRPSVMWENYASAGPQKLVTNVVPSISTGISYKLLFKRKDGECGRIGACRCPISTPKEVVRVEERIVRDTVKIVNVETRAVAIVYFEKGKSKITEKQMAPIDFFVNNLGNTGEKILITGSADTSTWNDADNMKLAQKRADAVKAVLVEKYGIREDDIDTEAVLDVFEDPVSSRSAILE